MSFTLKTLFFETMTTPREAAQQILFLGVSRQVSIMGIIFAVCLRVIFTFYLLSSVLDPSIFTVNIMHPLPTMILSVSAVLLYTVIIFYFGTFIGGTGRGDEVLCLVAWGQVILAVFLFFATIISFINLQLTGLFLLISLLLFVWIFITFVDVAHRFNSLLKAFFVTLSGQIAAFLSITIVNSLFSGVNV